MRSLRGHCWDHCYSHYIKDFPEEFKSYLNIFATDAKIINELWSRERKRSRELQFDNWLIEFNPQI